MEMDELQRSVEEVWRIEREVQEQVIRATETGEEIDEQVSRWLEEVHCISAKMKSNWLDDEMAESKKANRLFSRTHQLSKLTREQDVIKMTTLVNDLVVQGKNILCVCFPVDPKGIELVWRGGFVEFKSRKPAFDRIMDALRDENVGIIGIFGLGGIGKTKMVLDIGKKAKDEKLFNQVVMATVTQFPNIRNIQGTFADMLNLKFKQVTETGRGREIQARFEKESKVLVILDDVWEKISLDKIQVPTSSNHKSCKIILTTRCEEVCVDMGCNLTVRLNAIETPEALALFSKYAELQDQKSRLIRSKVKSIVKQCGGLPLAIVTVGSALRDKSLEDYEDALQRLSSSNFVDVESTDKEIYSCLKLSYDYLQDDDTKNCLLLCSLYPEDKEIEVEELIRCAYGKWLFQNVNSVDEARKRVFSSLKKLENACLLDTVRNSLNYFSSPLGSLLGSYFLFHPCVKMHDMVRDVALWINKVNGAPFFELTSSKELQRKHMYEKAAAFYLNIYTDWEVSSKLEYPNLKILMIAGRFFSRKCITFQCNDMELIVDNDILASTLKAFLIENLHGILSGKFLEMMSALQVLYLSCECTHLPISLSLHNLRSLFLLASPKLIRNSDLSIIGKMKNLEIFHFGPSEGLEVLPEWIGELHNLRLLDLSRYLYLEKIPHNLLSKLVKLEELYMPYVRYRESWSDDYVSDLMLLPRLTVFSGWFMRTQSFPRDFRFGNLQRYYIMCMLSDEDSDNTSFDNNDDYMDDYRRSKRLGLDNVNEFSIKVFEQLLPTVEFLQISGPMKDIQNICPQLDAAGFQNLEALILWNSESLECLLDNSSGQTGQRQLSLGAEVFPNLIDLELYRMQQLHRMFQGLPLPGFLGKLRRARITQCPKLRNIVPLLFPIGSHSQLDLLVIKSCDELKYVYEVEADAFRQDDHLPLLHCPQAMELHNLHSLQCIWKWPHQLDKQELMGEDGGIFVCNIFLQATLRTLNSLTRIKVHDCDKLQEVFPLLEINNCHYDEHSSKLVELALGRFPKSKCLWNDSKEIYCLGRLKEIFLKRCDTLVSLFTSTLAKSLLKLETLCIEECRALETIILQDDEDESLKGACSTSPKIFQELKSIIIKSCGKLKSIFPDVFVSQGLPKLRRISIEKCAELQVIFGNDEKKVVERGELVLNNLHSLELVDVPRLVSRLTLSWNLIFTSLSRLKIAGVTFKHSSGSYLLAKEQDEDWKCLNGVLPIKASQSLADIWEVEIANHSHAEEVFDVEEAQESVLTRLGVLKVANLPNLKQIWKGSTRFVCLSSLQEIAASNCASIRSLLSLPMVQNLPCLKLLRIEECPKLEYIFHDDMKSKSGDDDEFAHMKRHSQKTCFPKLEKFHIKGCDNLKFLFPLSIALDFPLLKEVYVKGTPQLEQLFREDEEWYEDDNKEITLPSLKIIRLEELPCLSSIYPLGYKLSCQSLEEVELIRVAVENSHTQVLYDLERKLNRQK